MSTCISKEISCPNCGAVHKIQMWPGIDRLDHPELRAKIMDETFFDWKCPQCGYVAQMTYPCLYHDRELGLMVCLAPGHTRFALEIPKYLDNVAKRAVSTTAPMICSRVAEGVSIIVRLMFSLPKPLGATIK